MNIFNNCQSNQYASDYIQTKKKRAQKNDIKIVSREKKQRLINNDMPFDINTNIKSKLDYDNIKPITVTKDISGVLFIDPSGNLFNTQCPNKYLDYIEHPKVCFEN